MAPSLGAAPYRAAYAGPAAPSSHALAPGAGVVTSLAPFLLQATAPPIQTFAADCATPKTDWSLGDTVCVKVSAPTSGRRVQLVGPAYFITDPAGHIKDVTTDPQTVTFTLPSVTTFNIGSLSFDNRGTWRVNLIDTADATVLSTVPITVHDPVLTVANLQINKTAINSSQATAGADIQSAVWVFNAGPDTASNVRFTDVPPANTTFQSLTQTSGPAFNCTTPAVDTPGTSLCTRDSLANGEAAGFVVTYKVNSGVANAAELTSAASVTSDTIETEAADNGAQESLSTSNPTPPACTMTCPDNITVEAAMGENGAAVTFAPPTLGGTCGSVTTTPASGSFFPIGTTVVTSTTSGGQSCSFAVTVNPANDTEAPTISCPPDIAVNESSPSTNSATVNYTVTAADNSGAVSVNCNPPSGSVFPAGTTEVRCTATDPSGNSAECSFSVTVNQVGCSLDANSPAPVPNAASLPPITRSCSVTLLATDDPTATDACGSNIIGTTPDRTFDVPGTYTVVWTYTDGAGRSATQEQTVTILPDNSAPVPDEASLPTVTGECSASITGEPPTATDNCGGAGIVGVPLDPLSYNTPGTHVVRWKFSDAAGNSTIQNQTVVVTDSVAPVVTSVPADLTVACPADVPAANPAQATATDNCGAAPAVTVSDSSNGGAGSAASPLVITRTFTATDAAGNKASRSQTITVIDSTPPTLNAPDIVVSNDPGSCSAVVLFAGLSASDNCGTAAVTTSVASGSTFPKGTTVVTATAKDAAGNVTTKTFSVTVNDTEKPSLSVPANITAYLPLNSAATGMPVSYSVTAADNCGVASLNVSPASGSVFPVGTTTVTATATDTSGNTTTGSFTVTVLYDFTGFFSPVANPAVVNAVNAGRAVPVKFSLSGNKGLNIFAANSPSSAPYTCGNASTVDVTQTVDAVNNSINYDASADQYNYIWKTDSSWAGQCRTLTVTLNDGSTHTALFKFK